MGPPAVGVYFVLWAVPVASAYAAVVSGVAPHACPLQALDTYAPAFLADGVRGALEALRVPLPERGAPLSAHATGIIWGLIAADVLEPLRIAGTLYLTPKIVAAWRRRA